MQLFHVRSFLFCLVLVASFVNGYSQVETIESLRPDPVKEKMYFPYLATRHGGIENTLAWKASNTIRYYQELWYYCESFSIKRNHLSEGIELDEFIIDISRFEQHRLPTDSAIVVLPGMKDALVLLPENQLKHKPEFLQK